MRFAMGTAAKTWIEVELMALALDGEEPLPGFRLPLAELFEELSFE